MPLLPSPAPSTAAGDPLAGTPYRSLSALGQGGMGEVLEAEHRTLHRRVVVKLLHAHFAGDPRFVDRLRVEAQALAAVSSPHVVSVSDLGRTPAGRPYFVMERLQGCTLREELLRRGPLPVVEAVALTRQVLVGLAAAHRLGIVHRDVKLDNVFLCASVGGDAPVVKVLDFGIAKLLRQEASVSLLSMPQYPTEEGVLVGSPRTISPEQARFQKVDGRTDVYAVGLLLYTLIVGAGPFSDAEDVLALLNAHISEAPTPPSRAARQYVPPTLDQAILRALAKRPEHRFQSAELFAEELGRVLDEMALLATTTTTTTTTLAAPTGAMEATGRGTLVMRPPRADPEATRWFTPASDAPRVVEIPANLTGAARPRGGARLFVRLMLASMAASAVLLLLSALLLRYLRIR